MHNLWLLDNIVAVIGAALSAIAIVALGVWRIRRGRKVEKQSPAGI